MQAAVLRLCANLSAFNTDGSRAPTPWLKNIPSFENSQEASEDNRARVDAMYAPFVRPPPQQALQQPSRQDATALLAAAVDRLSQRSTAQSSSSSDATSSSDASEISTASSDSPEANISVEETLTASSSAADASAESASAQNADALNASSATDRSAASSDANDPVARSSDAHTSAIVASPAIASTSENNIPGSNTQQMSSAQEATEQSSRSATQTPAQEQSDPSSSSEATSLEKAVPNSPDAPVPVQLAGLSGQALHDALVGSAVKIMQEDIVVKSPHP